MEVILIDMEMSSSDRASTIAARFRVQENFLFHLAARCITYFSIGKSNNFSFHFKQ